MTTMLKYGNDEYELDYTIEKPDYSYPMITLRNPINGGMEYKQVKYYDTFVVSCNLWNYGVDQIAKIKELELLKGKKIYFKPYSDDDYIIDSESNYVYFWVTDVTLYQLATSELDFIIIRLVSSTFINSSPFNLYVDENGDYYIIDDEGGFIHE